MRDGRSTKLPATGSHVGRMTTFAPAGTRLRLALGCEQVAQSRKRASIEWQLHDWQNWVQRIYQPAALAAGVTGDMRAYRLRASFVSLALWEGRSLMRVADQAGHSVATLAKHYAGIIEELEDQPKVPAAEAIRRARETAGGQLQLVRR